MSKSRIASLRPLLGLLLLCASLTGLHAQTVEARLDIGQRETVPSFIEYIPTDGGIVTLGNMTRRSSRYLALNRYDGSFTRTWTQQALERNGRNDVDYVTVLGENIFVFTSEFLTRERSIRTTYSVWDLDGNAVVSQRVVADEPNQKEHKVDLNYVRSINKRKLLCYKTLANAGKPETLLWYLFDESGEAFQKGEITLPYPDEKFAARKVMVSNQGNIYILGKYYLESRLNSPDDYGFKLFRYSPGESAPLTYDFDAGDLFITDLAMKIDRNENVYLAGFFSHKSASEITGTLYYRLDSSLTESATGTQRFSEAFLNKFLSEKQIERGRELRNFYLDNIILRSDGGVLLIAEKFYISYNSYIDIYGYWQDQKIYHYDDVIINSVSADGALEWSSVAYKRQSSDQRDHLGYLGVVSGENLYLLYDYEPRQAPHTVYMNAVSMEGDVGEREILFTEGGMQYSFFPRWSEQISNTQALITLYNSRQKIWSILKIGF